MIYGIMLLVFPIIISIIVVHFGTEKKFLVGKETPESVNEMDEINQRILEFMKQIPSNMKNYSIQVTVKDGKVSEVVTGTALTEKNMIIDSDNIHYTSNINQKAFSLKNAKVLTAVLTFFITVIFNSIVLILMEYFHII